MHICSPRATIKTILKGFTKKLIEVKWTTKKYSTNPNNSKAGMKHRGPKTRPKRRKGTNEKQKKLPIITLSCMKYKWA